MGTPSRRGITRRKHSFKPNGYNPNAPDWNAVHRNKKSSYRGLLDIPFLIVSGLTALGKRRDF